MEIRLINAIGKLTKKLNSVPIDERVPENPDYTRLVNVIQSLKNFYETLKKVDKLLQDIEKA